MSKMASQPRSLDDVKREAPSSCWSREPARVWSVRKMMGTMTEEAFVNVVLAPIRQPSCGLTHCLIRRVHVLCSTSCPSPR